MTETEIILLSLTSFTFLTINTIFGILRYYKLRDIKELLEKNDK